MLDVKYEVNAEMIYEGTMMNYTVKTSQIFSVRNNREVPTQVDKESEEIENKIEPV